MDNPRQLTARVRSAAVGVVPAGLRVAVTAHPHTAIPTFDITVLTSAGEQRFSAVWAGKGWPADVERAIGLAPTVDVVFAAKISEGAQDWLSARHRGWVDESGSANISLPTGLVIFREARRDRVEHETPNRWTRTMLTAVEAACAGVPPTVEAIEERARMSRGAAANALARLERMGLLARSEGQRGPRSARRIVDLDSFIDQYATGAAELRAKQKVIRVHRLWNDPLQDFATEVAPVLDREAGHWAVTGDAASTLIAPYLGNLTVIELYVDKNLFSNREQLASALGGRIVDKGHRIEVRELPTPVSTDGPVVNQIHVALPVRVYADLLAVGGWSAEAAHHLRETIDVGPRP
jgi:hypothetical protein